MDKRCQTPFPHLVQLQVGEKLAQRIETAAFEFAVRVQSMEGEAQGNYIDWLRVTFESLGIGSQGSLFPDADEAAVSPA